MEHWRHIRLHVWGKVQRWIMVMAVNLSLRVLFVHSWGDNNCQERLLGYNACSHTLFAVSAIRPVHFQLLWDWMSLIRRFVATIVRVLCCFRALDNDKSEDKLNIEDISACMFGVKCKGGLWWWPSIFPSGCCLCILEGTITAKSDFWVIMLAATRYLLWAPFVQYILSCFETGGTRSEGSWPR